MERRKGTLIWYGAWVAILLLAALILLAGLSAKSLWIDELFTIQVATEKNLGDLIRRCIEAERRPPLHFLAMHYWLQVMGDSDVAARLPSVFFALLGLPLLARLARAVGTGRLGVWPAALLACAPTFVLYSRMARAYSMSLALGLLSAILFLDVLQRPSPRAWLGYMLSAIALLYTDYALISVILAQNLYVAYLAVVPTPPPSSLPADGERQGKRMGVGVRAWFASQVILLLAFVPWLGIVAMQTQRTRLEADFGRGLMGYVLKLAFPALSLSVGETIFPWHPAAIAGLVCVAVLVVMGVIAIFRKGMEQGVFVLLFLVIPFLFTAILLSSVATDITFINMASRTLFALPFFILILAAGWVALPVRPWRMLAITVLAVAWGASLLHYYQGRDFLNPIYVVPMREIVQEINRQSLPGDVIVSDDDSVFGYYYGRSGATTPDFSSFTESDAAKQTIAGAHSPRVWLVTLGRDRTRVDAPGELFATWLEQSYQLAETRGYAAEDPLYRRLKENLLKRPDYEYKAIVRVYVRRSQ